MKVFLFSAIALCVASSALGQYQTAPAYGNGYKKQNKMAPTPQSYGNNNQMKQQQQQQSGYGMQANQMAEGDNYGSSMMMNDDAGYMKQGGQQTMKQQMGASGYGQNNAAAANSGYGNKANGNNKYQEEPQHPPMPFAWGYDINDGYGATQYHKENGDEYGKRTGSYGYMDAYGVYRNVYYVADENGFRATIKTNEPGTANESPADVELTAEDPPANVFMGNKDNSGYSSGSSSSSSSSSSYDSQNSASSSQYGQGSGLSNEKQYGSASGDAQQQQYGSSAAPMMQQSASRYNNKSNGRNNGQQQQQYGAGPSGMQGEKRYGSAGAMSGAQMNGASQYGSAPAMMAPAAGMSQYGQGNQGMMMAQRASAGQYNNGAAAAGGKMRRYGSGASAAQQSRGKGQYQGGAMAMMMDAAEEMTTQQYGNEAAAPAIGDAQMMQQAYGSMNPMNMASTAPTSPAAASGYGSSSSANEDQSTAQQYGPASMLNSPQMQQYNQMGAQTGMDGTSTYSSTRMSSAVAGQSAGYGSANRSGASRLPMPQTSNGDYEAQTVGQNGGYGSKSAASNQQGSNQDYKKTAKNIAALMKRY